MELYQSESASLATGDSTEEILKKKIALRVNHSILLPMEISRSVPSTIPRLLFTFILHFLLFFYLCQPSTPATLPGNETDRLALLAFKNRIVQNPLSALNSWNASLHFCQWRGISCALPDQRVTVLNLTSLKLVGSIPPHLGNLTFLAILDLSYNSFGGEIPPQLGRLSQLQRLNLSHNSFRGMIPSSISNCLELVRLGLGNNQLVGEIPAELGMLPKLRVLSLYINNLTGSIPPSLGNLSTLVGLSLAENTLEGGIPADLGRLKNLEALQLTRNQLSGTIPPSLYNLSRIRLFSVTYNQFHGSLPPDLFIMLPDVRSLLLAGNLFAGQIPVSLPNASSLQMLDMGFNDFTGGVPADLGRLQYLQLFILSGNRIGAGTQRDLDFLDSLPNSTNLQKLGLIDNRLEGVLPNSIANLSSQLNRLTMGYNNLFGSIPSGIGNLLNLAYLSLEHNNFTGAIPASIGKLQKLKYLELSGNRLSRQIPSSMGDMTELIHLYLQENQIQGSIPSSLGNCQKLLLLNLSQNSLSGNVPKEVVSISSLSISLNLARNSLVGPLPTEVGRLTSLEELDISENRFADDIPVALSGCESLLRLHMEGNSFHGTLPLSLSSLRGLEEIDLSRNNLSGQIPSFLEDFTALKTLNLSFNDFEGQVPTKGVFGNANAILLSGNAKLCGGIPELNLTGCAASGSERGGIHRTVLILIIVVSACLILFSFCTVVVCWRRKSRKRRTSDPSKEQCPSISYTELLKATDGFSSGNLIGAGSYGSVFKGHFERDDRIVAVKVLNLQRKGALRSFLAECEALTNVRHRNLVKIITACSSIDYNGNDFKALVFEYLPNGSLEEWLHPEGGGQERSLSLHQRLNIAIDVASALDYLHNHCQTPISHCDLKPSNVLLDHDMVAHVSDFGIARFLSEEDDGDQMTNTASSLAVKGTVGYVAPEYGMGSNVSTMGDVYSYGILILEMFTGKRPTEDMFKDGLSIHEFVKTALTSQVLQIADPQLLSEHQEEEEETGAQVRRSDRRRNQIEEKSNISNCLDSVFGVGVACSAPTPGERMQMKDAVNKMHVIRNKFLGNRRIYRGRR